MGKAAKKSAGKAAPKASSEPKTEKPSEEQAAAAAAAEKAAAEKAAAEAAEKAQAAAEAEAKAAAARALKEALDEAASGVAKIVDIEDYYFGADKEEKKKAAIDAAVSAAERALAEKPPAATQAHAYCSKGRALAYREGRERQAEEFLSKALKLDPQLVEAWNALGENYWNQQNYAQAKSSFEQALELCGPNAVSLRNLSMVLRAVGGDDLDKATNYAAGLQKAKEATVLDANDPQNWETLGNAYLGEFFVNGKRSEELSKALIAYTRAETAYEKIGKRNPMLHMNRGTAAKFLEDYDLALRSFRVVSEIGVAKGQEEVEAITELVQKLAGLVGRRGDLKTKRLKELTTNMDSGAGTLKALCAAKGQQPAPAIIARVVSLVDRASEIPVMLVCCDAAGEFFVLSIYNAEQAKIAEFITPLQTTLQVAKPHFKQIRASLAAEVTYPSVRVAHPADVIIVGGQNLSAAAVRPLFSSERAPA